MRAQITRCLRTSFLFCFVLFFLYAFFIQAVGSSFFSVFLDRNKESCSRKGTRVKSAAKSSHEVQGDIFHTFVLLFGFLAVFPALTGKPSLHFIQVMSSNSLGEYFSLQNLEREQRQQWTSRAPQTEKTTNNQSDITVKRDISLQGNERKKRQSVGNESKEQFQTVPAGKKSHPIEPR